VKGDGSGEIATVVKLDAEALTRVGGQAAAETQIPLQDLERAGWKAEPWKPEADGGVSRRFTHAFGSEDDLAARLADLFGAEGAVRDPEFSRDQGLLSQADELALLVDLQAPTTGIGSDNDLRARLAFAGIDIETLDAQLTDELQNSLFLTVAVTLPDGTTRTFESERGEVATFRARESSIDWDNVTRFGIALALFFIGGLFLLAARMSARRNRMRQVQRGGPRPVEHERAPLM
jgi:hypothetical protein